MCNSTSKLNIPSGVLYNEAIMNTGSSSTYGAASGSAGVASEKNGMNERYGEKKNNAFTGKILVIAFVVLLAGALAYIAVQFKNSSSADVTAVESGGSVIADDRLNLRVDVTREDPSKAAYCIVTAMDYDKAEVGRREFIVPASNEATTRHSVDINTRERGYAGKIYGCSSTIPAHLKQ